MSASIQAVQFADVRYRSVRMDGAGLLFTATDSTGRTLEFIVAPDVAVRTIAALLQGLERSRQQLAEQRQLEPVPLGAGLRPDA